MPDIQLFKDVSDFIDDLPTAESAMVLAHIEALRNGYNQALIVKTLKGRIKELIVRHYRIIFFQIDGKVYIVDVFKKQSNKTPKRIIERAEKIYKQISTQI